jgi:hypothetical protein
MTRLPTGVERRMPIGYEPIHALVHDHSRFAYGALHPDGRAATVTRFVERRLAR